MSLIIALDFDNAKDADDLISQTREFCSVYKVGLELFISEGPRILDLISKKYNAGIFLDLKLHDIPNTVAKSVSKIISYENIKFLTIHTLGGQVMMRAAQKIILDNKSNCQILGVSVLTSHSDEDLEQIGLSNKIKNIRETALNLVKLGYEAGLRAFVCSPHEAKLLKDDLGQNITLVCPGVRPNNSLLNS